MIERKSHIVLSFYSKTYLSSSRSIRLKSLQLKWLSTQNDFGSSRKSNPRSRSQQSSYVSASPTSSR
ncbi:hypothetical protein B5X24_HaOG208707 [Helicoverpa armigera]|uniref:Uncharacterized protein n=1 Tax=Helicoverpa armigera TaxID=29058 RepID=A0A2W1BKR5_HELAM|nr:hypothetical protein B5X24_HaOG208707 [Helicoverpa armigera]